MTTDGRSLTRRQLERRNRVLDAAAELATEGGYDAVQMRVLATRSGVALATIYKYFESKDRLLMEAIDGAAVGLGERLGGAPAAGSTPAEQVVDVFRRAHRWIEERPQMVAASLQILHSANDAPRATAMLLTDHLAEVYVPALRELDPGQLDCILRTIHLAWRTLMRDWVRGLITMDELNRDLAEIVHLLLDTTSAT